MSQISTYKQKIKSLSPICFLTFDGDTIINRATGMLQDPMIPDESLNHNDGILQTNGDIRKSYLMGQNSLVKTETNFDENSIVFAPWGFDDSGLVDFPFEKTLVEVLHNESLLLDKDYTISFLFRYNQGNSFLRNKIWNESQQKYVNGYNYSTFERTLIRKGTPIHVKLVQPYLNPSYMSFSFPGYEWKIQLDEFPKSFFGNIWHITMVHEVQQIQYNLYRNVRKVFINGVLFCKNYSDEMTLPYSAKNVSPFEIGGNRDHSNPNSLNDRQTSPFYIDQIAIFNKKLSDYEVIDCFKRTGYYTDLILSGNPKLYIPFNDNTVDNTNKLNILVGEHSTWYSTYSHKEPKIKKGVVIADNRIGAERGAEFFYAQAKVEDDRYNSNIINLSNDFTIEFWLGFTGIEKGVVLSCQANYSPFDGLLVEVNKFHETHRPGMVQLRLSEGVYITAPEYNVKGENVAYNDGVTRHYAFVRKNKRLSMFIDGVEVNFINTSYLPSYSNATLYFMGILPDGLFTNGIFGQFAYYERALGSHEISARAFFAVKMVIKGKVKLQGVPFKCDIRIYNHNTGNLLHEYQSDGDGNYYLNVYTNDYIDVIFLSKDDPTVQMRAFGNIVPQEYID